MPALEIIISVLGGMSLVGMGWLLGQAHMRLAHNPRYMNIQVFRRQSDGVELLRIRHFKGSLAAPQVFHDSGWFPLSEHEMGAFDDETE